MRNSIVAIVLAVLIHALLAAAIVLYLDWAPGPTVSAELDLSSVELSFAEKEDETQAVAPSLPAPSVQTPPKPKEEQPPESKPEKPLPPDPSAYKFPEPEEIHRQTQPLTSTSPLPAPRQAKIDAPPCPKWAIKPEYPKGARQRGEQGNVVLEIEVGADGACAAATVVESSGFAELDAAALKAVRTARFTPAKAGDRPVASTARLTLTFRLK